MEFEKLLENVKKELKEIGEQGLNVNNLETVGKLADIYKDLKEAEGGSYGMPYREGGSYQEKGYNMPIYNTRIYRDEGYQEGGYNEYGRRYMGGERGGSSGSSGGGYNGYDPRMRDHMNRIMEGAEQYEYGRDRYQHGGSQERVIDGLEKLMYALCMFIESTMEFAQSPQEKEIIRKHIHKIKSI